MATEERKVQLGVTVDATGAKQGFEQVKADAKDMAQAVAQAGQAAGAGLDGGMIAAVKRAQAATGEATQTVMTWTGFLKQNMGPAMKEALDAGASHAEAHTAAIRKIAVQWQAYKDTVKSSGAVAANAAAGIAQSTTAAATASDKLTVSQQRLLSTLERETIVLAGGKAAWREHQAAQLGVTDAASAYIAKIRQAEQSQGALGMSAKQLAFNLRGVPAQFTDIITSLQGGQRPLQVLLQQGGQLKDMFGGIGPAARALGGYIVGLINPITITAGVVGTLGYAFLQGEKEMRGFQNAATITGNAIGVSASQFASMRDSIAGIGATKGKAAEVLTEIAANGKIAGTNIKGIAEAAILMEKATGQATAKTIEQFAELAKSPADASAKLNEQYNFLTASVYKQIKALEEQGKTLQAANLAEQTYADAIKQRAQTVVDNAGVMERAWRGVTGAAKGAWDVMLGVGRAQSLQERLDSVGAEIARGQGPFDPSAFGGNTEARAKLAANLQLQASLQEQLRLEKRGSEAAAERNRLEQLGISFAKEGDEFKSKTQRRDEAVLKEQVRGQELINAGKLTQLDLDKRIAAIREKFKDGGSGAAGVGQNETAAIRGRIDSQREINERLRKQISGDLPLTDVAKLTQAESDRNKVLRELQTSITGVARAEKLKTLAGLEELVTEEKKGAAYERTKKALLDSQVTLDKQVDSVKKQAESIRDQALGQEAVNANMGKSKTAIEQATLAQMRLSLAEADASDRFAPAYVAALAAKVRSQEEFVAALQKTEYQQERLKLTEAGRVAGEEAQTLQLELSLLGQSREVRERIIAQRRVEVKLAKELADIEKLNLGEGPEAAAKREELRAKARANAVVEANNAANKAVLEEWQRTADSINNSLTDALMRGFESGKGFAQNLRDTLVNMFKTLVLRPTIQGILSPISAGISGLMGAGSAQAGQGGMLGNLSSGISAYNNLGTIGNAFMGGYTGISGLGAAGAGGSLMMGGTAAAGTMLATDAMGATVLSGAAGATGAGGIVAGAQAALAAIPVAGWIALAATVAYSLFAGKGGGPKNIGVSSTDSLLYDPTRGDTTASSNTAAQQATTGIIGAYNSAAKSLGIAAEKLDAAVLFSIDDKGEGDAMTALVTQAFVNGRMVYDRENAASGSDAYKNVGRTPEELAAAIKEASADAVLAALKATDMPAKLADYFSQLDPLQLGSEQITAAITAATNAQAVWKAFDQLGPSFSYVGDMAVDATAKLIKAGGGFETFSANLTTYYENFYTEEEKRRNVAEQIRASLLADSGQDYSVEQILGSTREQFRAGVEAFAAMGPEGEAAYLALLKVAGAFASITEGTTTAVDDLAESIKNDIPASILALSNLGARIRSTFSVAGLLADSVARAEKALADASQRQNTELLSTVDSLYSFANGLKELREQLDGGSQGGLFGGVKYDAARQALSGANAENAPELVQRFLDAASAQAGDSLAYRRDVAYAKSILASLESSALAQAGSIRSQIAASDAAANFAASARLQLAQLNQSTYGAGQAAAPLYDSLIQSLFGQSGMAKEAFEQWASEVLNVSVTLPSYAVGTPYVPQDGPAYLHRGEAVIPAAFNVPRETSDNSAALIEGFRNLDDRLRAIEAHSRKTADMLVRVTRDGNSFLTEAA